MATSGTCPLCSENAAFIAGGLGQFRDYACKTCGSYRIDETAIHWVEQSSADRVRLSQSSRSAPSGSMLYVSHSKDARIETENHQIYTEFVPLDPGP